MRRFIDQGWRGSAMLSIPRGGLACAVVIVAAALALPAAASADFTLTVNKAGTGTGTVKCVVGLGPVEDCEAKYAEGTELTLVPEAGPSSEFVEFSGDCGPLACELTMDANHTAVATFDLEPGAVEYPLTIAKAGTGTGTVQCEVESGPIGSCAAEYPEGTELSVLAEADLGSKFTGFSGACSGSSCDLTMSGARSVTATFDLEPATEFALTVTKAGTGTGAVLCEAAEGPEACKAKYPEGTEVALLPAADSGSSFTGFSGACSGPACTLTMDAAKSVTATFTAEATPEFALTVGTGGTGSGTVQCKVGAGSPGACAAKYPQGTAVTLTAVPNAGSEFVEWTGDCTGSGSCEVTMSAARSVTAIFNLVPRTLSVTTDGTGSGTVQCKFNGGSAGACTSPQPNGTSVEIIATANGGSTFAGFGSGTGSASSCSSSPCSFTITANSSVTATFNLEGPGESTLTITPAGTGTGTVQCKFNGGSAGACTSPKPNGTTVEIIATANSGSTFTGFSGGTGSASSCSTSPCSFTLNAASAVTATFTLIPRTLTITPAGTGTGTVQCKFNGGSAGPCTSPQPNGTAVQIIATPSAGSEFTGFSGGTGSASSCSTSPCSFTITANSSVTATFNLTAGKPSFALKVKKTGTGTGKVISSPVGIDCGSDCSESYEEGTVVTLSKSADAGSVFVKWTGACTGIGTCKVTMSEAKEVTAEFNLKAGSKFTLKVKKAGTGTGKVTSSPPGIDCGSDCEESYAAGTVVTLSEDADAGSEFVKWTGACTGTGACEVTMSEAREVTAEFQPFSNKFTLAIEKIGTGTGTVKSSPAGIDCGSVCEFDFADETKVTLTATPDEGSAFDHWTGSGCNKGVCVVTMAKARTIKAVFDAVGERTLTVSKAGTGTGTVTSAPKGIDCGSTCSASFDVGKKVTLLAGADTGSTFTGFSGACTGTGPCKVTMSEARSVTATFEANASGQSVGLAVVAGTAKVKDGKAQLKVLCNGPSVCKGELRLGLKVPGNGGQAKRTVVIGKASFDLQPGASVVLRIKLSRRAMSQLADRTAIAAKVAGTGIHPHAVRLKNV